MKDKAELSNLAMTSAEGWITNYSDDQARAATDSIAATSAQTTMHSLGLSGVLWDYIALSGALWCCLVLIWARWCSLGLCCALRCSLVLSGALCCCLAVVDD